MISQRDGRHRSESVGRREEQVLDVKCDIFFLAHDRSADVSGSVTVADRTTASMNHQRRRHENGIGNAVLFQVICQFKFKIFLTNHLHLVYN